MRVILIALWFILAARSGFAITVFKLTSKVDNNRCPSSMMEAVSESVRKDCGKAEYLVSREELISATKDETCISHLHTLVDYCHHPVKYNSIPFAKRSPLKGGVLEKCETALVMRAVCIATDGSTALAMTCQNEGRPGADEVTESEEWKRICQKEEDQPIQKGDQPIPSTKVVSDRCLKQPIILGGSLVLIICAFLIGCSCGCVCTKWRSGARSKHKKKKNNAKYDRTEDSASPSKTPKGTPKSPSPRKDTPTTQQAVNNEETEEKEERTDLNSYRFPEDQVKVNDNQKKPAADRRNLKQRV